MTGLGRRVAKGRARHDGFVEALGHRVAKAQTVLKEVSADVDSHRSDPGSNFIPAHAAAG
jgi:hypothetical protein